MNKRTFTADGFTFARVTKKTARTAYATGLSVIICPVNLRPFTPWHCEHEIRKDHGEILKADAREIITEFDKVINSFEYYNCTNSETGKYCAYYLPVKSYPGGACYDYNYMNK